MSHRRHFPSGAINFSGSKASIVETNGKNRNQCVRSGRRLFRLGQRAKTAGRRFYMTSECSPVKRDFDWRTFRPEDGTLARLVFATVENGRLRGLSPKIWKILKPPTLKLPDNFQILIRREAIFGRSFVRRKLHCHTFLADF